ncbi:MAG: hypothetical protein WKF55_15465 [Gemmatimonadaceae bacterium]
MTTNQKASLAIVAGTLCGFVTMTLHPTGHDVIQSVAGGGKGSLNVMVHSLALLGQPLIVMGTLALTLQFRTERVLAVGALVFFAWASAAIMIAATASGFIATALLEQTVREQGAARDFAANALGYTVLLNRSFDKVYVSFSALALLLWSVAMIREKILSRSLAVYGIISGILMLAVTLSGRLKFNIHGFGAVVLAQGIWLLWMSVTLRQAEQR